MTVPQQLMIDRSRSALVKNNDDNTSSLNKETKEDGLDTLLRRIHTDAPNNDNDVKVESALPLPPPSRLETADTEQNRRGTKSTVDSGQKTKRSSTCRPPLASLARSGSSSAASPNRMAALETIGGKAGFVNGASAVAPLKNLAGAAVVSPSSSSSLPNHSLETVTSSATNGGLLSNSNYNKLDDQEQALFEQRLCEDVYGVAIRKINQHGKSSLRYVKCVYIDSDSGSIVSKTSNLIKLKKERKSSSRSISSRGSSNSFGIIRRQRSGGSYTSMTGPADNHSIDDDHTEKRQTKPQRALVWGKKKDVQICLDRFTSVRIGKKTERARRNSSIASHVLSLLTNDPNHPSLDIEAPTRLDRDKFARAFAKFLKVPLEGEDTHSVASAEMMLSAHMKGSINQNNNSSGNSFSGVPSVEQQWSASISAPGDVILPKQKTPIPKLKKPRQPRKPPASPKPTGSNLSASRDTGDFKEKGSSPNPKTLPMLPLARAFTSESKVHGEPLQSCNNLESSSNNRDQSSKRESSDAIIEVVSSSKLSDKVGSARGTGDEEEESALSSLTGHGYDQEIVEEMHQALTDLRVELEESRAEAARAVKVAEQAIQSAERNNSVEWQNTVTHKAAEAAALAQKRSAEAMAKARLAEERLEKERRAANFWRKQAEAAEEEAGALQTRAAAAEVQRAGIEEQLESERRMARSQIEGLKSRIGPSEVHQREALEAALERNRALELDLDGARRDLQLRTDFQENAETTSSMTGGSPRSSRRKKLCLIGMKKRSSSSDADSTTLLADYSISSCSRGSVPRDVPCSGQVAGPSDDHFLKLHSEAAMMRKQFDMLKKSTEDELRALPLDAKVWGEQVSKALTSAQSEVSRLQERLSIESSSRRKLLQKVQDLRGVVRVYCRPRPLDPATVPKSVSALSLPSQETIMVHRDRSSSIKESSGSMTFEFDRIFQPDSTQHDVYSEIESVCLGVLEGFNICIMAYGQTGSGKTRTLLGDVKHGEQNMDANIGIENHGIQLQCMRQLFSVAGHRKDRYSDTFSLSIVEVRNERLCDRLAGTESGDSRGNVITAESKQAVKKIKSLQDDDSSSGKQTKLEIRTDVHGDTIVQGLLSVRVESFDEACRVWDECLLNREQSTELETDSSSHLIANLKVVSTNIATGIVSVGKIQFVDLASADLLQRRSYSPKKTTLPDEVVTPLGNNTEWKFANRSLETLSEVVTARSQFTRSVPYRNSTLTHLLRDSLDADTKVILLACVSSDINNIQETIATLRFASLMRKVTIGKATKHTLSPP